MADQTTRTLLLNFKSDTKSILDLGVLFAKVEEQAKGMLSEQEQALNKLIAKTDSLAKAKEKSNKEQAKLDAQEAKAAKDREATANREFSLVERRLAQTKALEEKRNNEALSLAGNQGKAQLNAQASYAKQRIKDEEDLANKTRQITLNSLKQTIEERNNILNAASKQRLGNAIGDITSAESSDRKKLLASLRQDMTERAKLQQEEFNLVERGLQQTRTREAERAKIEEAAARQRLERQAATNRQLLANETDFNERQRQNQLRGMRTSATSAFSEMPVAGRPAVAPIPRIPEDVRSGYDSLFARIGAINIEYRLWNEAINTVTNSLRAIPKIGIELEATKSVLTAVMGSEVGMESVLKSLTKEADRTGMSLEAIRTSFRTFSASTTLAGESLDSTWKMFTNMNTVITALHLSTDQANHVFLALSQIFNKSKVQSEELVKQLGNLLPGAFASFQKANQDAFKSTMALSQAMKQGTVFAQETVEKFTNYMATRFANAFDTASQGLNANLNRMQSSFIALGEAIYGMTGGPLQAAVKGITNLTNYFTAAIKGENDFIATTTTLAEVLAGALVAGFVATIKPATMLMEALYAASTAATVLKANLLAIGGTAVIAGITTVFLKLNELGAKQASIAARARKDIEDLTAEKKKADMMEPIAIRVENDPNVRENIKNIKEYNAELIEVRKSRFMGQSQYAGENGLEDITKTEARLVEAIQKNQERLKDTKFKAQAQIEAADAEFLKNQITHGVDLTTEIQNAHVIALEAQGKYVEAAGQKFENQTKASFAAAEDQIRQQKARVEKLTKENKEGSYDVQIADAKAEIEKLENFKADLKADKEFKMQQAQERLDKKANSAAKSAASERLRGIKEEINVVKEYQRTAANDAENQIKVLNAQNDTKLYSFEEYARRKQEILKKDYDAEVAHYAVQKALAEKSGKRGLVTQAEEQLNRLKSDYQAKSKVTSEESKQDITSYETSLNSIHEKYQDILGLERDSNELTKEKLVLLNKQIEAEITEGGKIGARAIQAKEELRVLTEAQNLRANFRIYSKDLATAEKLTTDVLQRNNELKQAGQITELQFLMSNTKAKEKLIRLSEQEVDNMKKALEAASPEARPAEQAKYDLAVQRLESLKLVADETGAFIENALGSAFESSFEGLITKSMTASQAFANFGKSVMQTIAKIVAEEMKSQLLKTILKPLAGAALSGLGSLGQSAGLFQATNISSNASFVGPMKPTFAANGGVFTGAGISAHSGTVVSSPTVFPFAKGVGLMGEAGPEAILPLKRNAQGKLGVAAENAGQSNNNLYNITVNVQSKQGENPEQFGQRAAAAMMRSIAKEEISNSRRPGNTLNKARFG